jgi:outer membrane biosynthesis protein TonB
MKKVLSALALSLVSLSLSGVLFAAEAPKAATTALPPGHPPIAQEAPKAEPKAEKKVKKTKKAKKAVKKEEAKPVEAPAAK